MFPRTLSIIHAMQKPGEDGWLSAETGAPAPCQPPPPPTAIHRACALQSRGADQREREEQRGLQAKLQPGRKTAAGSRRRPPRASVAAVTAPKQRSKLAHPCGDTDYEECKRRDNTPLTLRGTWEASARPGPSCLWKSLARRPPTLQETGVGLSRYPRPKTRSEGKT